MIKKIGICFLGIVLLLAAVILGYVLYMQAQYYRIEDFMKVETKNQTQERAKPDTPYRIMTYNIGFGAYSADYSFFMDTGEMKDGTKTAGMHARAGSKEEEEKKTAGGPFRFAAAEGGFYVCAGSG